MSQSHETQPQIARPSPARPIAPHGRGRRPLSPDDLRPKRLAQAGIGGVILDFDGTLALSSGIWKEVDRIFFERRGLSYGPDYAARLAVLGFEDGARYTIETYGLTDTVEQICTEWNELGRELYRDRVQLRPGVEAYLAGLRAAGVPFALATTNDPEVVLALEPRVPIRELLPVRVHGCEVARHTKEDPDIYLEAARRLGVEAQACVVFEDILPAVLTARGAGMRTVGVATGSRHQNFAALAAAADAAITTWEELG